MTGEYQPRNQPSSSYDPKALSSPNPEFEDRGLLEGDVAVADLGPAPSSSTPPPFCPLLEGRLFTAHDAIVEANCKVHPTARLLYDSLPQEYRDVFNNCPMYLEKHLEFVKYLRHLSLNDLDKKNQLSLERDLIKALGISVPTDGDKKKWQCGVIGCEYKGTLQHLVSHLRTKSHIGIPTFACTLDCKILFRHSQDRDRHVREKTCLKSHQFEDTTEPQGSTRSLRGVQDQFAAAPKPKVKSRVNQQLAREREYQPPAQTSAQGSNDPRTRNDVHYDPRFQVPGNGGHYNPGIPFTPAPPQPFVTSVHWPHAYHQAHSNILPAQDERARMHPAFHGPVTPDFFLKMSILPMDNGGMYAKPTTNNIPSTADNFQPTNNPQFTHASQPVNPMFNHSTRLACGHLRFGPRVTTRFQDPGQSSTSHSADPAGNFYGSDPPPGSHRRPHDSRHPPPYDAQTQGHSFRRDEDGGKKS